MDMTKIVISKAQICKTVTKYYTVTATFLDPLSYSLRKCSCSVASVITGASTIDSQISRNPDLLPRQLIAVVLHACVRRGKSNHSASKRSVRVLVDLHGELEGSGCKPRRVLIVEL